MGGPFLHMREQFPTYGDLFLPMGPFFYMSGVFLLLMVGLFELALPLTKMSADAHALLFLFTKRMTKHY